METLFIQAKQAGKSIAGLSDELRNDVLRAVADELVSSQEELLRRTWPAWTRPRRSTTG